MLLWQVPACAASASIAPAWRCSRRYVCHAPCMGVHVCGECGCTAGWTAVIPVTLEGSSTSALAQSHAGGDLATMADQSHGRHSMKCTGTGDKPGLASQQPRECFWRGPIIQAVHLRWPPGV